MIRMVVLTKKRLMEIKKMSKVKVNTDEYKKVHGKCPDNNTDAI